MVDTKCKTAVFVLLIASRMCEKNGIKIENEAKKRIFLTARAHQFNFLFSHTSFSYKHLYYEFFHARAMLSIRNKLYDCLIIIAKNNTY